MLEGFTAEARRVVVMAQMEARRLDRSRIGTEHLLLGVIDVDQETCGRALAGAGTSAREVRARAEQVAATPERSPAGTIPFTPAARWALERSRREAFLAGRAYVETQDILLGLLRYEDENASICW
jgi:ATP-dependent Clp protease ATP-binding subunit ClpC